MFRKGLDGFFEQVASFFVEAAQKSFVVTRVYFPTYRYYRDREDSITNQKDKLSISGVTPEDIFAKIELTIS